MLRPCRHAMCISISCMLHVIDVCTAEEAFAHDLSLAMFILVIIDILNSLLDQWTSETQKMNHMINSPSFSIKDSQNHFLNEKSIVNEDINIDTLDEDN